MRAARQGGLPAPITRAVLRTVRPKDLAGYYSQPRPELARLERQGLVRQLAPGFYMAPPDDAADGWTPTIEAAGLAIATAVFGARIPILDGVSAARVLGLLPRAVGIATVAVPRQHRPIDLSGGGTIRFVKRSVQDLDARLTPIDRIGRGLIATEEQILVDLARRGGDGLLAQQDLREVSRDLLDRVDLSEVRALAARQRGTAPLQRLVASLGDEP
jgi:hypothetical protein